MKKIMIFDCLDTIQGYKGAKIGYSKQFYQEHVAKENNFTMDEFLNAPVEEQLYLTLNELQKGNLEPIMLKGAKELLYYVKEKKLTSIIITADLTESAVFTTKPFVDKKLIFSNNIHGIFYEGNKKQTKTWTKIKNLYFPKAKIKGIFEDSSKNLVAAVSAYNTFGYQVCQKKSKLSLVNSNIVKGNLFSLLWRLQNE